MNYLAEQRADLMFRAERYKRIIGNLFDLHSFEEERLQRKYDEVISQISSTRDHLAETVEVIFSEDLRSCELKIPHFEENFPVPEDEIDRFRRSEEMAQKPYEIDLFFAGLDDHWIVEHTMPLVLDENEGYTKFSQTEGFAALAYFKTSRAINCLTSVKRLDFNPATREFTRREVDFLQATQQEQQEDLLNASSFLLEASDLLMHGLLAKECRHQVALEQSSKKQLEKEVLSSRAKKAARKRHERNSVYKKAAIEMYEKGEFKSQADASRRIAEQIRVWAMESSEPPPLTESNGASTVERWIREHRKMNEAG
ncbi:hypothetical protein ACWJJH_13500 [Endozoicomonadaceae bacterium StTr2]